METDRTLNERTNRRVRLDIYLNKIVDDQPFMCRATDISVDGIYLSRLIEPEFAGQAVSLEFCLPGSREVLWARGEIVRSGLRAGAEGSGIRFTAVPSRYREAIHEFVLSRLKRRRRVRRAQRLAMVATATRATPASRAVEAAS